MINSTNNLYISILLACDWHLSDEKLVTINKFLDSKEVEEIAMHELLTVMNFVKELDLEKADEVGDNVYLDAFVALGGQENKEGAVSKETLINILKNEFEMTIDLE